MDDSSPHKAKEISHLDNVYELHNGTQLSAADDNTVYGVSKEDATPPKLDGRDIYELVVKDAHVCFSFVRSLKLEVIMFIYMFSYVIRSVSSTTMIIEKVCLVHMGFSEDLCNNLQENVTIKTEVEKLANNYNLLHTLLQVAPSAFLACFIGPWSDRYGRKFPIVVAFVGIILDGVAAIACAAFKYSRIEYYAASALFTGLSGGFVSVLTVVYSSASDTTTPKNRTLKYTLLELAFGLGMPLGNVAGGWIYKYSGYVYVFTTSVVGHFCALLWVIFVLEETSGLNNKDPLRVKIASLFKFQTMLDSFRAVSKKRPHLARLQIWLLVLSMCITVLTFASTGGINYLFVYHQYNWGNTKYSTISAIFSVIGMFSILAVVPLLTKVLKVDDAVLGIVGSASAIIKNITISFAKKDGLYYLANLLGLFGSMANLAGRSRISKIVAKSDLGKVFSFVSATESFFPIVGTAGFAQLFNASLNMNFPGLVYLVMGLLMVISLLTFIWIAFLPAVDYDALLKEGATHEEKDAECN